MKQIMLVLVTVLLAAAAASAQMLQMDAVIAQTPAETLSPQEEQSLLFMIEEEKLARDVYQALYEEWGLRAFANIARSEQTHMDAIAGLIERYDLDNPLQEGEGSFTDPELASLYDDLLAQGSRSIQEAVKVGMTIEDLDIKDLMEDIEASDNDDLRIVYQNLLKGSRNHMRAFYRQVQRYGTSYDVQYINDELYAAILGSRIEARGVISDPEFRFEG